MDPGFQHHCLAARRTYKGFMAVVYKISSSTLALFLSSEKGSVTLQIIFISSKTLLRGYASSKMPCQVDRSQLPWTLFTLSSVQQQFQFNNYAHNQTYNLNLKAFQKHLVRWKCKGILITNYVERLMYLIKSFFRVSANQNLSPLLVLFCGLFIAVPRLAQLGFYIFIKQPAKRSTSTHNECIRDESVIGTNHHHSHMQLILFYFNFGISLAHPLNFIFSAKLHPYTWFRNKTQYYTSVFTLKTQSNNIDF